MYRSCVIVNCASKRKDVKLFQFPMREAGLQKWLDCINYEELRNKSAKDLSKRFVCQKHFEQKFIITFQSGLTRLHVDAYPTLFSDSEISSGTPAAQYLDHADIFYFEHTYTRKKEHQDHTYFRSEHTRKYERIITEIDAGNKDNKKDENKENEYDVNKEHESEANINKGYKDIKSEENKEIENEENRETEEADITSFENTDLVDYVTTWTDDMPSTSGCVNEAPENPITKDAVITSIVPPTPKSKVRRRVDNNEKSHKAQPKKCKKSPNCTTSAIKFPRQLKLCHKTASKLDKLQAKSYKKGNDRINTLAKEIMWMHESEENNEHENEENMETEGEAYVTSLLNTTDLVDYVTTWTDDMPSTSGCVNEATVNPITKDAVFISIVPSTPKLKVRKRRVDSNKINQKDQPKKIKSSPNSAIPVIKSLRQLKNCHKTARKVNLSKTRSFKKVTDRMDPLAKDIMWMLIKQCTRKGLSTEDKHKTLSTLQQVQSVTESCIKFLSSQDTP